MAASASKSRHRPRELRTRVVARARVRSGAQWSDACILNVSSRGLMIRTARPMAKGTVVEILRGDLRIVARVAWSEAGRSGLQSDERLPVEDILSLENARALQLIASDGVRHERRKRPRGVAAESRLRGRAMEFLAVAAIGVSLAGVAWAMAQHAMAKPLASASAALGG